MAATLQSPPRAPAVRLQGPRDIPDLPAALSRGILAVLCGAFALAAVWGLRADLPFTPRLATEQEQVYFALKFGSGDFNPHFFGHPPLFAYALFGVYGLLFIAGRLTGNFASMADFERMVFLAPEPFYLAARIFVLLLAVAAILVFYRLAARLYGRRSTALAACLLLGSSATFVTYAHYASTDVPMMFVSLLAFTQIARVLRLGRWRDYGLAGLLIGLAAATKYNAASLGLPLVLAHAAGRRDEGAPWGRVLGSRRLWLAAALIPAGFLLGCPYAALDFGTFRKSLDFLNWCVTSQDYHFDSYRVAEPGLRHVVGTMLPRMFGAPAAWLVLVGLAYALMRRAAADRILAPWLLIYAAYVGGWSFVRERYFIHLTPYENPGRFMGAEDAQAAVLHAHVPFVRVLVRGLLELHRINNALPGEPFEKFPLTRRLFRVSQQCNARNYTINISQGCIGECTFCVIPKAKGRTRSLPVGLIVEKLREKVGSGVRHVTLSSDDSGAYGIDIGTDLVELMDRIDAIPGEFSLYINCFDPRWWTKLGSGMRRHLAYGRIKYLQSTLQSGSNRVLRRMKRAYDIERVMPILGRLRAEFPDVVLASQFIAGFPGETEEDLARSQAIIEQDVFDHLFVFDYSPRPDADSESLDRKLPAAAIRAYGNRLRRAWNLSNLRIALGLRRRPAFSQEVIGPSIPESSPLTEPAAAESCSTGCAETSDNPFARV